MAERASLFNTGHHKARIPIQYSLPTSVRLAGHNPRNCPVVSYLMIETRAHSQPFFKSGAGEEADDCGGEPLIPIRKIRTCRNLTGRCITNEVPLSWRRLA